jgi:DNA-binding CsgD family transcriptional regulator
MNTTRLNKIRQSNREKHLCDVTDDDYQQIKPKLDLLKRLSEVERSIYAVYDMHKMKYLLKSEEQIKLFGFKKDDLNDIDEDAIQFKNIHPDDLPFVLETENLTYDFFAGLPADQKKDYKLVYDFRTRNMEGIYIRYMHQVIILEQDKKGRSWLTLVISDLLSDRAAGEKPQRRMINMKTGKLYLFNTIDDDLNSELILSKRECEVLSLIGRGYDSMNISDKLNISVNTVNNHRQNILRKTKMENTTQALLFCKRLGVI